MTYRDLHSGQARTTSGGTLAVCPSSVASSAASCTPSAGAPMSQAVKEGFPPYGLFKPFFSKHLLVWSKARASNLGLGGLRCDARRHPLDLTEDGDKDAVDLQFCRSSSVCGLRCPIHARFHGRHGHLGGSRLGRLVWRVSPRTWWLVSCPVLPPPPP